MKQRSTRIRSYLVTPLLITLLLFGTIVIGGNLWIVQHTEQYIITGSQIVPYNDITLVLGTSKRVVGGHPNKYYEERIAATAELFRKRKTRHVLASGDNSEQYYNEPKQMKESLVRHGIPAASITLDYAGFRTLDAVVRAKEIFQVRECTIITQRYHAYRAIFLARHFGLKAVAYCPHNDFDDEAHSYLLFREYFARIKALLDVYILRTTPKFLGKKEPIQLWQPTSSTK